MMIAKSSRRWIKRSIWLIGISAMLYLTISDFIPLLDEFRDEDKNVLTQVDFVTNKPMPRPTLVVYIPYYGRPQDTDEHWIRGLSSMDQHNDSEYEDMKNHSSTNFGNLTAVDADTTRKASVDADTMTKASVDADTMRKESLKMVTRVLEEGEEFNSLKLNATQYQTVLDAVWMYFWDTTNIDMALVPPYAPNNTIENIVTSNAPGYLHSDLAGQIPRKTMDRLFDSLLRAMLAPDTYDTFYSSRQSPRVMIDTDALCFLINSNEKESPEQHSSEADEKTVDEYLFNFTISSDLQVVNVGDDPSVFYSPHGNFYDAILYETNQAADSWDVSTEDVLFRYSVEAKFTEKRSGIEKTCTNDTTTAECIAKRHVASTVAYCGCIPFKYRFLENRFSDLPYCHVTHYERCYGKLVENGDEIVQKCSVKCEHTFYKWKQTVTIEKALKADQTKTRTDFKQKRLFKLGVGPAKGAPYLEFVAVDKITLQQFFSQLGGSMGLYLGCSGLTLFAVIILTLDFLYGHYLKRITNSNVLQGSSNVLTLLWTKSFLYILGDRVQQNSQSTGNNNNSDNNDSKVKELSEEITKLKEKVLEVMQQMQTVIDELNQMKKCQASA